MPSGLASPFGLKTMEDGYARAVAGTNRRTRETTILRKRPPVTSKGRYPAGPVSFYPILPIKLRKWRERSDGSSVTLDGWTITSAQLQLDEPARLRVTVVVWSTRWKPGAVIVKVYVPEVTLTPGATQSIRPMPGVQVSVTVVGPDSMPATPLTWAPSGSKTPIERNDAGHSHGG